MDPWFYCFCEAQRTRDGTVERRESARDCVRSKIQGGYSSNTLVLIHHFSFRLLSSACAFNTRSMPFIHAKSLPMTSSVIAAWCVFFMGIGLAINPCFRAKIRRQMAEHLCEWLIFFFHLFPLHSCP